MKHLLRLLPLLLAPSAFGQDLAIAKIADFFGFDGANYLGESPTFAAYTFATTSCNVGDQELIWIDDTDQHPVIAQNMFRIADGRIEQLGYSWLKHGFCALNDEDCSTCEPTPCATLGIGCSDTYSSSQNDGTDGGAKSEVNPTTGQITYPFTQPSSGPTDVRGRLRVAKDEIEPASNPGALYFIETQYVSEQDHMGGNARNNVAYREIEVVSLTEINGLGVTTPDEPAIYAWSDEVPGVTVTELVNSDEGGPGVHGYLFVGHSVTEIGNGQWRYEYAIQNLNSDQGVGTFSLPLGCGANVSDVFFRDVNNHSGDIWENTDWTVNVTGDAIVWAAEDHATNPFANALRWGELYNFGFTADVAPVMTEAELGLFKPGVRPSLTTTLMGPCEGADCSLETVCQTAPNSAGAGVTLASTGSTSLALNDLAISASGGPVGQAAVLFYGPAEQQIGFGDGTLCVTGGFYRLRTPLTFDAAGSLSSALDNTQRPLAAGPGEALPGSTLTFQLWYLDPAAGGSGFNMSDALRATFCP